MLISRSTREIPERPSAIVASSAGAGRQLLYCLAALTAVGLGLRVWAAQGDLWLDEIWSLRNVEVLTSIDQVFWRINDDNNHILNSLWLYLVGAETSPLVQRSFSIVLGAAAIVAAAWAVKGRGRAAPFVAATLFAVSYPMVHYGSEARGYIGLVLCLLLAIPVVERRLDNAGGGLALAVVAACGFLAHMTMLGGLATLGLWTLWLFRGRGPIGAVQGGLTLFGPVARALIPIFACMVFGSWMFGFNLGGYTPFSMENFAAGYGGMIKYLVGLPDGFPNWLAISLASGFTLAAAARLRERRASLYVIGIVVLPAVMLVARLPNLEFPRYFIVSGTLLLLLVAEVIGRCLDATGSKRILGGAALAAMVGGGMLHLKNFSAEHRGFYQRMVAEMTAAGPTTYAAAQDFRTAMLVDHFDVEKRATLIPHAQWCAARPEWFILDLDPAPPPVAAPTDCGLSYRRVDMTMPWGLSGFPWALYRLEN